MARNVVGLVESSGQAQRLIDELQSNCGCRRSQIESTPLGSARDSGIRTDRGGGRDEVLSRTLEGAAWGATLGGLLGLIAALIPLVDAGPIASAVTGAALGAIAGALGRVFLSNASEEPDVTRVADQQTLITVRADTDQAAACAARTMRSHGAIDVEERPAGAVEEQVEEQVVPLAEEELAVGKREVAKGGVRIHTRVQTVPAERTVELREEHAIIERRPVDRAASADEGLFAEQTFEVLEMSEEAVVQKRARIREEVRVVKQSTQRSETVRDHVRKTEVEVERGYGGPERRRHIGQYSGHERRAQLRAV